MKILGREPALFAGLVSSGVSVLAAFVIHVSTYQQSVINAVAAAVLGLIVAATTRDGVAAGVLGLVQAFASLAIGFGWHASAEQQAVIMGATAAVISMWTRTQVTAPVPASALGRYSDAA